MHYRTIFLLLCICGVMALARRTPRRSEKSRKTGDKIVNGDLADIEDFPFQVGIGTKQRRFFCGGAIVARKVIFTAAHCVTVIPTSTPRTGLKIFAGVERIDDPNAQVYDVEQVHVHPDWDYHNLNNDFAILILKKPLEYSYNVKPVPVTTKKIKIGKDVMLSGFGRDEFGVITGALRFAKMMIVPRKNCQRNLGDQLRMTKAMICLESDDKMSACHGDSGGPLLDDGVLIGVTSFGSHRHCKNGQVVYANLHHFLDFIGETVPYVLN